MPGEWRGVGDLQPIDGQALDLLLQVGEVRHHLGTSEGIDQRPGVVVAQVDGGGGAIGVFWPAEEHFLAPGEVVDDADPLALTGVEVVANANAWELSLLETGQIEPPESVTPSQ
jgi:hypothetical protein